MRLLGPQPSERMVYLPGAANLENAAGLIATVYAAATGPTLADILTYDGTSTPGAAVSGSQLTVDSNSRISQFWFPADTDTVYVEVSGGPRTAVHSDSDIRIDYISGGAVAPMMSTGITSGGEIAVNGSNVKAIDIAPLVGYIVDTATTPASPTTTRVETTSTATVELDATAQTRVITWWMMDSTGTVVQQATRPTNTQRRTHLQLGETAYNPATGAIFSDQTIQVLHEQMVGQLYDLLYGLGPFIVFGSDLSANGANKSFNIAAGGVFTPSYNKFAGPTITNDPHVSPLAAQSPVTFRHLAQVTPAVPTTTTTLDVAYYDVGGTLTAIGGGTNQSSIFRVWGVPANLTVDQIVIQYGQATYGSLLEAQAAIGRESYIVNPQLSGNAALIGHICAIRSATNLSDTAQASFHKAAKFGNP